LLDKFVALDFLRHLILPALCAAGVLLANPLLVMRNSMLEVIREEFMELAKAKGLPASRLIFRHAVPNALLPVVTMLSIMAAIGVGGNV
jgi:peptide/nickel transport system permease protein